jgi:hypothetical protein
MRIRILAQRYVQTGKTSPNAGPKSWVRKRCRTKDLDCWSLRGFHSYGIGVYCLCGEAFMYCVHCLLWAFMDRIHCFFASQIHRGRYTLSFSFKKSFVNATSLLSLMFAFWGFLVWGIFSVWYLVTYRCLKQ